MLAPERLLRDQQTDLLRRVEREIGTIQEISHFESGWRAPESYIAEMGDYLSTVIIAFDGIWHPHNLAYAKARTQKLEDSLRGPDGHRIFNINPGMIDKECMRLASHKPSARRYQLADGVWVENQMYWKGNKLEPHDFAFQEYLMGKRYSMLRRLADESLGHSSQHLSPDLSLATREIGYLPSTVFLR
ncbi:MAG: DUF4416 family protein [Acidobacteria bacterium]|nr:DUF4416 family protein [Acidobacteriota bacterium]